MDRRQVIKLSVAGTVVVGIGGAASLWLRPRHSAAFLTVDEALAAIDAFSRQSNLASTGTWNPFQVFSHCAQSIEYSMQGYPQQKSELFQNTVGSLAFSAFARRGEMTHNLGEPIPGAPAIEHKPQFQDGLARLRKAFETFRDFKGELAPHFAYGKLSKREYEMAHVMHFYNHLAEINTQA